MQILLCCHIDYINFQILWKYSRRGVSQYFWHIDPWNRDNLMPENGIIHLFRKTDVNFCGYHSPKYKRSITKDRSNDCSEYPIYNLCSQALFFTKTFLIHINRVFYIWLLIFIFQINIQGSCESRITPRYFGSF